MGEHTPTPWAVDGGTWIISARVGPHEMIGATDSGLGETIDMDNAAYIVQACNAFPDLVKALENISRLASPNAASPTCAKIQSLADTAIAKAKAGS